MLSGSGSIMKNACWPGCKVFLICFLLPGVILAQGWGSPSFRLADIIRNVENFKPFDPDVYPLGNFAAEIYKADALFAKEQLALLSEIPPDSLSESESISAELIRFILQDRVAIFEHQLYLTPIQADQGFHLDLNHEIKPFNSYEDVRKYLKLLHAIPLYTSQHFELLKTGLRSNITQPKLIFNNYESTYKGHIVEDYTKSPFYEPFTNLPQDINPDLRDSIQDAARIVLMQKVVPSFRNIKKFFEEVYIPVARESIGLSELPGGREIYQNRINFYTTTTEFTPEIIHEVGLQEVSRINAEMQQIIDELGFEGSFRDFLEFLRNDPQFYATSGEGLLKEARNIAKIIDAALPAYFRHLPRIPYGVKKVPDALAPKYTGGRYAPPSAKDEPGYYLVNTYKLESRPLYILPALTAHEAVPGHHLQMSLHSELGDNIPQFRKELYLSAYGEGWALYTEYLGKEMGIYSTPYEDFGRLTYEMWRACRLVVDTGIHAMGWTREQAVEYMLKNTALSEHEVQTETDRYIAWPGQAISYKIGELKIRELRKAAENALGKDFDIREFHAMVLDEGTVTLPILEERIKNYIRSKN